MDEVQADPPQSTMELIGYLIGQCGENATYLHCSSNDLFVAKNASFPEVFEAGKIYSLSWSRGDDQPAFSDLPETARRAYEDRLECSFTVEGYESSVLRSILLGARILAFRERCATVISQEPLIISIPSGSDLRRLTDLHLLSDTGERCSVKVVGVTNENGRDLLLCTYITTRGFLKNYSRLEIYSEGRAHTPSETRVLEAAYRKNLPIAPASLDLFARIYGPINGFSFTRPPDGIVSIEYGDRTITFDEQQSAAMWRYAQSSPSFVVEGPAGSGKTLLAAAMAVSYCMSSIGGLQLLLCPTESTAQVLASVLQSLAPPDMKILCLCNDSDLSVFHGADKENNPNLEEYMHLQRLIEETTCEREQRALRKRLERVIAAALAACERQDAIVATPEQILGLLVNAAPSRLKLQLCREVSRVIVDHGEQVAEASLNALIIAFSGAMFAVLGDPTQPLPRGYIPGDLPSELAAAPALQLLKKKRNLPVISLTSIYRTICDNCLHMNTFYGDHEYEAEDPDHYELVLFSICPDITRNLVYLEVQGAQSQVSRDSLISDMEIGVLEFAVRKLRNDGFDHDSVMVVCFFEAQKELAKTRLPPDYQVVTMEESQGREAPIVIVLTTASAPTSEATLLCPRRVSVSVSRHHEALLVLGTPGLTTTHPWNDVILPSFDRVILSMK